MNFFQSQREKLGFTQRKIAESLGLDKATISSWENELSMPRLDSVDRVAEVYQVTSDRLMREMKHMAVEKSAAAAK